jgi:hypothetical protein
MDNIILDLAYDVNVILKKTWKMMGKQKLIWSPIQLRLEKKHKIVLIGRMIGVNVNIDGVRNIEYFEAIEIMDGRKPYTVLLGLDWGFDNHTIIDLKKKQMIFKVADLRVIAPLDSTEGRRYVELERGK